MGQRPSWDIIAGQFLDFFRARGHTVVPSSSLVPTNDPTLLFTNAGMVQFKDVFLGTENRSYRRAASLQKIMRVQGKHNDLADVGGDTLHHTFFLMLGNFSFGDYFKVEAIQYAWELMTRVYRVDPTRLVMTTLDTDNESVAAWKDVGVPAERIFRMGEATNFWMMGEIGPCGPNSEIHYDWGPEHCTCHQPDCSVALDNGCRRWLEVWNLVFMQYDQRPDGTRVPLATPGVDTGMGLERMTSVLQGVNDDYGTDLFVPLMDRVQEILRHTDAQRREHVVAYRVLADHGRAMTFLLGDGVVPGNEGRSYVLRMIMRRAMRFGRAAGASRPVLTDLASTVIELMGGAYPELTQQGAFILKAVAGEEVRFTQTLANGLVRLEALMAEVQARGDRTIPGEDVFRLYDTYGFPLEMTQDIAKEHGLDIDAIGFEQAMAAQRTRARGAHTFVATATDQRYTTLASQGLTTEFLGYVKLKTRARVRALMIDGEVVDHAETGSDVEVVLDQTPFYAESGGQVGDTGTLRARSGSVAVRDTRRPLPGIIVHIGKVTEGIIRTEQVVRAEVDRLRRWDIMRNHTATHLLHRALRETLGEHARQAGSLVAPDRLRFDFFHLAPLTDDERSAIEARVNERIFDDLPVRARWMSYDAAIAQGAVALFGEKYGDRVRMIQIDDYSRELCGGTHVARTSQIGIFKLTEEGSVGAGARRLEAVTGRGAYGRMREEDATLRYLAMLTRATPPEIPDRVRKLVARVKALEAAAQGDRRVVADEDLDAIRARAQTIEGISMMTGRIDGLTQEVLRTVGDRLKAHRERTVVVVGTVLEGRAHLVAMVTRDLVGRVHAGELVKAVAALIDGNGGGRAEVAQGAGKNAEHLDTALAQVPNLLQRQLAAVR
jgi:alanyl-tRNA synthetase